MASLSKFTLTFNQRKDRWGLEDRSGRTVKTFATKAEATAGGVLKRALGKTGGSVRIKKLNGQIEEERTYPVSRDPKKSPG